MFLRFVLLSCIFMFVCFCYCFMLYAMTMTLHFRRIISEAKEIERERVRIADVRARVADNILLLV